MFHLFKTQNPYEQTAYDLYGHILSHIRQPKFYERYGVPDTLDGRFDLLILHLFFIVNRLSVAGAPGQGFSQELFDVAFADMDQTLREMGIGDMGVPKHMRRMMKGFNGRVHAYADSLDDKDRLKLVLRRNLYGTVDEVSEATLNDMADYAQKAAKALDAADDDVIMSAQFKFSV